jgi:hypothetical protein
MRLPRVECTGSDWHAEALLEEVASPHIHTPRFESPPSPILHCADAVVGIACGILVALFLVQSFGTNRIRCIAAIPPTVTHRPLCALLQPVH